MLLRSVYFQVHTSTLRSLTAANLSPSEYTGSSCSSVVFAFSEFPSCQSLDSNAQEDTPAEATNSADGNVSISHCHGTGAVSEKPYVLYAPLSGAIKTGAKTIKQLTKKRKPEGSSSWRKPGSFFKTAHM